MEVNENMLKISLNIVMLFAIIGIVIIAVVDLVKGDTGNIALVVVSGILGFLTHEAVKNGSTSALGNLLPLSPAADQPAVSDSVDAADITQDNSTSTTDSGSASIVNTAAAATVNPQDVVNQAIQAIQNNPALLQDVISLIGTVENDPNLLQQIVNLLNQAQGNPAIITEGIAAVKALIPAANASAPNGA